MTIDLRIEGKFSIWFGGEREGPAHVEDNAEILEPPNHLKIGTMSFQLSGTDEGCLLTFQDTLFFDQRPETDFARSVLGGWHSFMDSLGAKLDRHHSGEAPAEPDYSKIDFPGSESLSN